MTADCPSSGSLAELLSMVAEFIRLFVALLEAEATVISLWVAHCHTFGAADTTPYLSVTSAERRCGKTRLLELLELLVPNPSKTDRCSAAVLSRKIDAECPALLLDESDTAFNGSREYAEALRGILNSGHRRGGKTSLCISSGTTITYRDFKTFSPKVIAGIGDLPDTVADRSIPIRLQRAISGEVERFHRRDVEDSATQLREDLAAWAQANVQQLRDARPSLPSELNDRQQDGAEALLAIADAAGGEWPERARKALIHILTSTEASDDSSGVRLLKDIHSILESTGRDRIHSKRLAAELSQIESSPWAGLTVYRLARLLRQFRIGPRTIRTGRVTFKGYLRQDFETAWRRYHCQERIAPAPT
jgi:hypothetical protein